MKHNDFKESGVTNKPNVGLWKTWKDTWPRQTVKAEVSQIIRIRNEA